MSLWKLITGRWGDSSNNVDDVRIDASTSSLTGVDWEHHKTHQGNGYVLASVKTAVDDGDFFSLTVIAPNTTAWMHCVFVVSGLYEYYARVYEGSTVDVTGTAVTPVNKNRNSSNTAAGTFRIDDTFTDKNGPPAWETYVASGPKTGGPYGTRAEFILKQNETYLFELESDANGNILSGHLEFYVHTDRN